ncbi:globin family protein [Pelomicrobium sp.]|jgi:hemoglobin-like flavoprotein|uniref:globin family protein n=1 Tax=Pelomicrobium sp. TaxID=2815319 RepID=UPI002FDCFBF3
MTPQQITLVQSSWSKILPLQDQVARLFYEQLFAMDPSLRLLFEGDMVAQGRKLMAMINAAVNSLAHFGEIVPAVQDLGRRHASYGVKESHYAAVGTALLWALQQSLGKEFTADVEQAWADVYWLLASVMKEAAATAAA